jgi:tRNA 5-methylaminomethyl-2-thiouridine biosynthesis bifunctional protein
MGLKIPNAYLFQGGKSIRPYFQIPKPVNITTNKIAIIGSGLAGCSVAHQLTNMGYDVAIFDKNKGIAEGASGNHAGMLKPYLTVDLNASDLFHTRGFYEVLAKLDLSSKTDDFYIRTGLAHYIDGEREMYRYNKLFDQRDIPKTLAYLSQSKTKVYYPNAITMSPRGFCRYLLGSTRKNIDIFYNFNIKELNQNSLGLWRINGSLDLYDAIVFCAGVDGFNKFRQAKDIPIFPSQGQISYFSKLQPNNQMILSKKGYILPYYKNISVVGATYRSNIDLIGDLRKTDHQYNTEILADILPGVSYTLQGGRVSTRCVTSDHLPIIGGIPIYNDFINQYCESFKHGVIDSKLPACPYYSGLYICSGFGSKGIASSILSAKLIASLIYGDSLPVSNKVYEAVHPARFWVKHLKKKNSLIC